MANQRTVLSRCCCFSSTAERERERELYIATAAGESGRVHLAEGDHLLTDYFGSEKINTSLKELYCLPDGIFRVISEDYKDRIWTLPQEESARLLAEAKQLCDQKAAARDHSLRDHWQNKIEAFWKEWGTMINIKTGEPFDETTRYQNPYLGEGYHMKDLHLARRLISPLEYNQLRTVMVGDREDAFSYCSDPLTPLVVVSNRVRKGEWNLVSTVVDFFFDNQAKMPWQCFDELHTAETVVLQNENYKFQRNEWSSRLVYCP